MIDPVGTGAARWANASRNEPDFSPLTAQRVEESRQRALSDLAVQLQKKVEKAIAQFSAIPSEGNANASAPLPAVQRAYAEF